MKYIQYLSKFVKDIKKLNLSRCTLYYVCDELIAYLVHGATPNDYIRFNFFKYKNEERKKFITYKRKISLQKKYDDSNYIKYFVDKHLFNKKFANFINRNWIYCPNESNDTIIKFIENNNKILAKPDALLCGSGIQILDKNNYNIDFFKKNNYLLEEYVTQNSLISELNPTSVNTIRIYTVLDNFLTPHIIFTAIRVGGKNNVIDNYHGGGSAYPIDIETGIISLKGSNLIEKNTIIHSPSTGKQVLGFMVPKWNELKNFIIEAAKVVPECRLIGWDVAITVNGFELIEGNHDADNDFLQTLDGVPKYQLVKEILKSY